MLQIKFNAILNAAYEYTDNPNEQTAQKLNQEWRRLIDRLKAEAERELDQENPRRHPRA